MSVKITIELNAEDMRNAIIAHAKELYPSLFKDRVVGVSFPSMPNDTLARALVSLSSQPPTTRGDK